MKVILAKSAGFCYGVRRAVELAEARAKEGPVYMLGHITHNDHVVARLEALGAVRCLRRRRCRTAQQYSFAPMESRSGPMLCSGKRGAKFWTPPVQTWRASTRLWPRRKSRGELRLSSAIRSIRRLWGLRGGPAMGVVARNWEELEKKLQKNPELYHMP